MKLTAQDITIERGERRIVSHLDFSVAGGEALIVTGRNGAGKTTLLRALAGLLPVAGGQFALEGVPAGDEDEPPQVAAHCHFVGHLNASKGVLTVAENLAWWGRYLGATRTPDLAPALDRFDLVDLAEIPAALLSAGQKRRLCLARLLVAPRPIWLLDEPSTSLDAASQATLAAVMKDHVAGGGMIVTATHMPLGLEGARELRLVRGGSA